MTVSFVAALYKLDDFHTHNKLSSNLISGNVKDRKERKRNKERDPEQTVISMLWEPQTNSNRTLSHIQHTATRHRSG